ncbi:MAG: hypothetical protein ACR2PS_00220 [Pseudomonadales bacterium]
MKETTKTISAWCEETFGPAHDIARVATRANEEMAELLTAATTGQTGYDLVVECADVVIVLARLADKQGFDLWQAVENKMVINRNRTWTLDGHGQGYHISTKESPKTAGKMT